MLHMIPSKFSDYVRLGRWTSDYGSNPEFSGRLSQYDFKTSDSDMILKFY